MECRGGRRGVVQEREGVRYKGGREGGEKEERLTDLVQLLLQLLTTSLEFLQVKSSFGGRGVGHLQRGK